MKNWMKNLREIEPYVPGEQPQFSDIIKLNTNENPYAPSPKVTEAINNFDEKLLRKYPDPNVTGLVKKLAETYNVGTDQVFVGVGSDDVIGMSFLTFFNSELPILFPDITYSFYDVWANLYKIPYHTIALNDELKVEKEDYYADNGGIIIANPNAPTSIEMPLADIEAIVKNNQDSVVIIDEAYADYGTCTALDLIDKYENLLVVRTFSKSRSMAGMRIGYAIGNPLLIKALNDVKNSYNSYTMNMVSIISGIASLEDNEYFEANVAKVKNTRAKYKAELEGLGFKVLESSTNFLFASYDKLPAKTIFDALKEKHIFVRYFNKPRIDNYLRITVGTDEEMAALVAAIKEIING